MVGGTLHFQIMFQLARRPSDDELESSCVDRQASSKIKLYVERTEKVPNLPGPEANTSSPDLGDARILRISEMPHGRKYVLSRF